MEMRKRGVQGTVGNTALGPCRVSLCTPLHLSFITVPSRATFSPLFPAPRVLQSLSGLWNFLLPLPGNFLPSPPASSPKAPSRGSGPYSYLPPHTASRHLKIVCRFWSTHLPHRLCWRPAQGLAPRR